MIKSRARQAIQGNVGKTFSRNFKRILAERRMSQIEFATRLNVTPTCVCDWVKGKKTPEWSSVEKICDFFQISPAQLFAGENDNELQKILWMAKSFTKQLEKLIQGVKQ